MHFSEIESYLQEIKRILKPGGRCIATYFIYENERNYPQNFPHAFMLHGIKYHVINKKKKLEAIAFHKNDIMSLYEKVGLKIEDTYSGKEDKKGVKNLGRLTHIQDCFVAMRECYG
jgi:ubiquinone/menaquinone biosynthesis C-methylase UbiE